MNNDINRLIKNLPIIIILTVAAILRFYNLHQMPYTFDEFSTLFRLNFDNFADLIEFGVKEDGHPAGMHVFMYYYTNIFGMSVEAVKSIFIIFGIISVYFVYKIGNAWFNKTAGLFAASLMAVLQFPVTQSQIARMYGFGILFVLLTVWFWYQYIEKQKLSFGNLLGFILSASVCSYTHYFSLLFVIIIGFTGLLLLKGKKRKYYVFSGIVIFLLFTPHFKIFLYQLHKGGINWLGPFKFSSLLNYIEYFFNQSLIIAGLIIVSVMAFFKKPVTKNRYRGISIAWFLLPIIIGAVYGMLFLNVMHEKVLYFSFPFILLFISSFIKNIKPKTQIILVLSIMVIGVFSLIKERKHYELFYKNLLKMVAEDSYNWVDSAMVDKTAIIKFTNKRMDKYYMDDHAFIIKNTIYGDSIKNAKQFVNLITGFNKEYLFFGFPEKINTTYLSIAKYYYPNVIKRNYTVAGETWLLKKGTPQIEWDCKYWSYSNTFDNAEELNGCDSIVIDSTGNHCGYSSQEYIGTKEFLLSEITFSKNNFIELYVDAVQLDSIGGALLVSSIEKNGKTIDWRSSDFNNFISINNHKKVHFTIKLPDINYPKNAKIKITIWNKLKGRYLFNKIQIVTRPGNPFIYGHIRKIPFNTSKYFCK